MNDLIRMHLHAALSGESREPEMKNEITLHSSAAEYLTFVAAAGESAERFEIRYQDENIWLTQKMMAALYGVDVRTINDHIKKILADRELSTEKFARICKKFSLLLKTLLAFYKNFQ